MASSPFPVEDQTDVDFFDNLVEDDGDDDGSGHTFIEHSDSDDALPVMELRSGRGSPTGDGVDDINHVGGFDGEKDGKGDPNGIQLDSNVETLGAEERSTPGSSKSNGESESESAEQARDAVGAFDSNLLGSSNVDASVKEVLWSAFSSDSYFDGVAGDSSYSEFFSGIEDTSVDPFRVMTESASAKSNYAASVQASTADNSSSYSSVQHDVKQKQLQSAEHTSHYWETLYPGWRYDSSTGQWYQVDSFNPIANAHTVCNAYTHCTDEGPIPDQRSDAYMQQTTQPVLQGVSEGSSTSKVSYSNQMSMGNVEYPAHMVFDPQYPGWYYDMNTQSWMSLESYTESGDQLPSLDPGQIVQNKSIPDGPHLSDGNSIGQEQHHQVDNYQQRYDHIGNWGSPVKKYDEQPLNGWVSEPLSKAGNLTAKVQSGNGFLSSGHLNDSTDCRDGFVVPTTSTIYGQTSLIASNNADFQSFMPAESLCGHHKQHSMELNHQMRFSPASFSSRELLNVSQQPLQSSSLFSGVPSEGMSSAGRPRHVLVAFGFGGKLIIMKDHNSLSSYGNQDSAGGVIIILNIMEVVMPTDNDSDIGLGASNYFNSLFQQSFPGPLASGNMGIKELNKWMDDKIASYATLIREYRRVQVFRILFSLLKIACQYYGKLRSPFGTDHILKESDHPESALSELFASAKRNDTQYGQSLTRCLQNLPSEGRIQVTALEVQKLLVSGRRMEALQCAQEGQLWGPAIVIAAQLGDQFYSETLKQMALCQLIAGSPLRTLCLVIAGQPAEVFSNYTSCANQPNSLNKPAQIGANCMLDNWEENLAIITSNRTKGDELVITHLGDCLWKEKGEVAAAHICYLVAEANLEPYSDTARICLIGADHWKNPRTYASPEAIQRTEVYEYAKILGNSQISLLPFQPYKLLYAHMLAEVGKLSDSLKYCQAILKSLKTGRAPGVDLWKHLVSSLEERIKIHQQGGYAAKLAPAKLVGKLLNFFEDTAHRVVGLPPTAPSTLQSHIQRNEYDHQPRGTRVTTSQSTMVMSSLVPSESSEPINGWTSVSSRKLMHNRSISEPDICRIPRKVNSPDPPSPSDSQDNTSFSSGSSRFGRFGSQLFQKTVGLVLRSRSDRQAKLGEKNKFYYDEKLKQWVEEGAEPPAAEKALPPPPTAIAFMNGILDQSVKDGSGDDPLQSNDQLDLHSPNCSERSTGMPPFPPGPNQFSARGRMGVRTRYVDTFNKGSGVPTSLFQSPIAPAAKPAGSGAKIFIPTPLPTGEDMLQVGGSTQGYPAPDENSPVANNSGSPFMHKSSAAMQRHPSMDSLVNRRMTMLAKENGSLPPHSRRTASWGGGLSESVTDSGMTQPKLTGEAFFFLH